MTQAAVPAKIILFPQNTQLLQVTGLQDVTTGNFLNGATVTATLVDQNGNPDSVINNLSLTYQTGSNGNYQGVVPAAFNAKLGTGYTLQLTAVQGGVQSLYSIPVNVQLRRQ